KGGFDGKKLLSVLDRLLAHRGLPVAYDASQATATLDVLAVHIGVKTSNPRGLVIKIRDDLTKAKLELSGPDWKLELALELDIANGAELTITPKGVSLALPDPKTMSGGATTTYSAVRPSTQPFELLSLPGGSKI